MTGQHDTATVEELAIRALRELEIAGVWRREAKHHRWAYCPLCDMTSDANEAIDHDADCPGAFAEAALVAASNKAIGRAFREAADEATAAFVGQHVNVRA